jgi:hypothetical protein
MTTKFSKIERVLGGVTPWDDEYPILMEQAREEFLAWEKRKKEKRMDDKLRGIRIMNARSKEYASS